MEKESENYVENVLNAFREKNLIFKVQCTKLGVFNGGIFRVTSIDFLFIPDAIGGTKIAYQLSNADTGNRPYSKIDCLNYKVDFELWERL